MTSKEQSDNAGHDSGRRKLLTGAAVVTTGLAIAPFAWAGAASPQAQRGTNEGTTNTRGMNMKKESAGDA